MMDFAGLQCPIPISEYPTITMAHGGGGRLTQMLIERMFVPTFANRSLETLHDGAILPLPSTSPGAPRAEGSQDPRLAFTTDSFVITPRFFPGGNIGSLAVHGTVNDLAMCGARPQVLSASFILEEGLRMDELWSIVQSMQAAAQAAGVTIVTGDTKVVDRGRGDGIYINTAGLGIIPAGIDISPRLARPGDLVLINGPIAMHGIAVMSVREGLEFETALESDAASLHNLVAHILEMQCAARARSLGWIRSTWQTKASAWLSRHRKSQMTCWPRCRRIPWVGKPPSSERSWLRAPLGAREFARNEPVGLPSAAVSAAGASWTCSAGNSCQGSADRPTGMPDRGR
jgi:hypothetical protein